MLCHEDALLKCFMFPLREKVSFASIFKYFLYLEPGNPIFFKKKMEILSENISVEIFF